MDEDVNLHAKLHGADQVKRDIDDMMSALRRGTDASSPSPAIMSVMAKYPWLMGSVFGQSQQSGQSIAEKIAADRARSSSQNDFGGMFSFKSDYFQAMFEKKILSYGSSVAGADAGVFSEMRKAGRRVADVFRAVGEVGSRAADSFGELAKGAGTAGRNIWTVFKASATGRALGFMPEGPGGSGKDGNSQAETFARTLGRFMAARSVSGLMNVGFEYAKNPLHDNYQINAAQKTVNSAINTLATTGSVPLAVISGLTSAMMAGVERRNQIHTETHRFDQASLDTQRSFAQQKSDWAFDQLMGMRSRAERIGAFAGREGHVRGVVTDASKAEDVRSAQEDLDNIGVAYAKALGFKIKEDEHRSEPYEALQSVRDGKRLAELKAKEKDGGGLNGEEAKELAELSSRLKRREEAIAKQKESAAQKEVAATEKAASAKEAEAAVAVVAAEAKKKEADASDKAASAKAETPGVMSRGAINHHLLSTATPVTDAQKALQLKHDMAQMALDRAKDLSIGSSYSDLVKARKMFRDVENTDITQLTNGRDKEGSWFGDPAWIGFGQSMKDFRKFLRKGDDDPITLKELRMLENNPMAEGSVRQDAESIRKAIEKENEGYVKAKRSFNENFINRAHAGEFKETSMDALREAMTIFEEEGKNVDSDATFKKIRDMYLSQERRAEELDFRGMREKYDIGQLMNQYTEASRVTDSMARQGFFIGSQVDVQDVNKDILAEVRKMIPMLQKMAAREVGDTDVGFSANTLFR